jgi:Tfp pilus assembly protein PilN
MKEIRFMGNASSHADLTNFIAALERSDSFINVSLSYAQQGEASGRTVINFEIISDLKKAS